MKYFLFVFIFLQILSAYITSTQLVNGKNILEFSNGLVLEYIGSKYIIPCKVNYKQVVETKKDEFDYFYKEVHKYPILNKKNILACLLNRTLKNKAFFDNDLVELENFNDKINNVIFGQIKVLCNKIEGYRVCFYKNIPIKITINDKEYNLKRIDNKLIKEFLTEKYLKPTKLEGFDFKKEPITGKFALQRGDNIDYFSVTYSYINDSAILITKENSNSSYKSVIIISINPPLEYRSILSENGENVKALVRDEDLNVHFLERVGSKTNNIVIPRIDIPVYDENALWYIAYYIKKHNLNNFKFSYLNSGRVNANAKLQNDKLFIKIGFSEENLLKDLIFKFDKFNRISLIKDKKNNYTIESIKYTNKTIEDNIKYLNDLFKQLNLKEIQE